MATPRALGDSSFSSLLVSLIAQADDPMAIAQAPAVAGDDAKLIAANPAFCRLSERSPDELLDRGWLTLCHTADDTSIDRLKRALYRREHLALDLPLARVDGIAVLTHCELLPVRDTRGVATVVLIVQRDISEARQTRDTLASLRAMTRRASHEVNNELASVIINLSLASSTRVGEDDRREHIRDALKAARGAAETAKRLTALATDWDQPEAAHDVAPPALTPSAPAMALDEATADEVDDADAVTATASAADLDDELEPIAPPAERIGSLLILDDDPIVKTLLTNYLSGCGFDVESTTDSDRCIEMYRDAFNGGAPYDLVILDLRIGRAGMGGMETLTALHAIDPQVRAIAHSGYSTDDVMLNPTRFGFVAAIKKPTAPSEIARALGDLIRVHGANI